ncbi:MAG: hypothetical protein K2M31_06235 [Muribaculaceae bacterium]|nr:hypothetical protein [Muribaculaceae bacterium]
MFGQESQASALGFGLCSILAACNVLGIILLLKWQKVGFYMIVVSSTLAVVVNIFVLNLSPLTALGTLIAIIIWWAILQLDKGGVSAWSQLESGWNGKQHGKLYQIFAGIGLLLFVLTIIAFGHSGSGSDPKEDDTIALIDEDDTDITVVEEESVAEKNLRALQSGIRQANQEFPQKIEEGLIVTEMSMEGDFVVYEVEVDEDVYDIDNLSSNRKNMRAPMLEFLNSSDPQIILLKNMCIKAEKGIAYKYVGDTTGKSFYIRFSCDELDD